MCRQAIEDLTGGVTSEISTSDILDKDKLWTDELMNVNKLFLFGIAQIMGTRRQEKGIYRNHAYPIMEARELDGFRLLKLKYVHPPLTLPSAASHIGVSFGIQ